MISGSKKKISESERHLMLLAELAGRQEAPEFDELISECSYSDDEKEEYLQKLKPFIRQGFAQKRRAGIVTMSLRIARSAAIIFIVFAVAFGFTFVTVEAFRVSVSNFFKIENQTYMTIDSHDVELLPEGWTGYALGKIPYGFYLDSWTQTKMRQTLSYRYKKDDAIEWIEFQQFENTRAFKIDAENKTIEEIQINNCEGYFVWDDSIGQIYLYLEYYNVIITSTLPKNELLDLAREIIYLNNGGIT